MTITAVHRRRGQLYLLELDGEPAVTVDVRVFDRSPFAEGGEIDDEELHGLIQTSRRRRAREKALWLLSGRDYAAAELQRKLAPEAGERIAAETVSELREQGLIREEAYARRLAEELCSRRHYSRRRAVMEMTHRGIGRELAEQAVEENGSDDLQEALALLEKKRYTDTDMARLRQRVCGFLSRQGYGYATVRRAWETWSVGLGQKVRFDDGFDDGGFGDDL